MRALVDQGGNCISVSSLGELVLRRYFHVAEITTLRASATLRFNMGRPVRARLAS